MATKPKKSVEDEVLDLLDMEQKKGEDRQEFLEALVEASNDLKDKEWNSLSEEGQDWINAAAKAFNAKKDIEDFPSDEEPETDDADAADRDERGARGGRGRAREEEEPAPRSRRAAREEPEDDAPAPRGGRSRRDEPADDEPAPRGGRRSREEPEADAPAPRGGRRSREEPEADEPAPRGGRRSREEPEDDAPARGSRRGREAAEDGGEGEAADEVAIPATVKKKIRTMIIDKPAITVDAIMKALGDKPGVSKLVVSNIRTEFREGIKALQDAKLLKKALL